ncbi:glycosyl hydrolase family 16 protein [Nitzschia inconspicua]|uniref:Glycosyl hydrolase family 16 protein n=1 Tax=Nitzschia inconspicua TaxID=303405 RepID=A0A9K3KCD5_9STRA|nr:glycosyl hydrolase family 16 protein [Nitzschia inconspicua]KAG7367833.1 glycosyl hydrolase family 16 protein [Nitzschia inconspicua]
MATATSTRNVSVLFFITWTIVLSSVSAYLNVGDILWQDRFDGDVVNGSHWSYDVGDGCPENCGWGNQELQYYTDHPDNVKVESGKLHIAARRVRVQEQQQQQEEAVDGGSSSVRFTSGRVHTQDKVFVKYGQIEARILIPDLVEGIWPAFWTLGANLTSLGWPACGEMDIFEMGSGAALAANMGNQRITSGAYWSNTDGKLAAYALHEDYPFGTLNGTYVIVRLDWTPDSISTSIVRDDPAIDEFPVWKMNIDAVNCPDCSEFHQEHFFIFNVAVGGMYTTYRAGNELEVSSSSSSSSAGCDSSSSSSSFSSSSGSSSSNGDSCGLTPRTDVTAPLPATMKVDWIRVIQNGYSEVRVVSETTTTTTPAPAPASSTDTTGTPTKAPATPFPSPSSIAGSYPTRHPTMLPSPMDQHPRPTSTVDGYGPTMTPTKENDYYFSADVPGGVASGGKGKKSEKKSSSKSCKSGKGGKGGKGSKGSSNDYCDEEGSVQLQSSELAFSGTNRRKHHTMILSISNHPVSFLMMMSLLLSIVLE